MADSTLSKTARASTRGKITKKAWHVSRESGKAVNRVKLVNHLVAGRRTSRMGWMTDDGQVLLDHQVEHRIHTE
ncbi:MAG: hypothetical protein ABGY42_00955 [bacterium]